MKYSAIWVPGTFNWGSQSGPWGAFNISIGSPPQSLQVLPSISESTIEAPAQLGLNTSNTWEPSTSCQDPTIDNIHPLLYCGEDKIQFNFESDSNSNPLPPQPIIVSADDLDQIGYIGLNPYSASFPKQSPSSLNLNTTILGSLLHDFIPSLSFGLSIGSQPNSNQTVQPSLVLGGFDISGFATTDNSKYFQYEGDVFDAAMPDNASFALNGSDFTIIVESMLVNNATGGRSSQNSFTASISSRDPDLRLPLDVCSIFEESFGIQYETESEQYYIDDTRHQALQQENPAITFFISPTVNATRGINITLPYLSFHVGGINSTSNQTKRYFPLHQANDTSTKTLGRTFLQEVYLIADFQRSKFWLHQATGASSEGKNIRTITSPVSNESEFITLKAILAVATCFFALGLAAGIWKWIRDIRQPVRKARGGTIKRMSEIRSKPELDGTGKPHEEIDGHVVVLTGTDDSPPLELQQDIEASNLQPTITLELEGDAGPAELRSPTPAVEAEYGEDSGDDIYSTPPMSLRSPSLD